MYLFLRIFGKSGLPSTKLFYRGVLLLELFVLFTVLFKYIEDTSWEESIWQAWQTFTTVGYGNQPASTTLGRIITILISTLGIALLGTLFSAYFDHRALQQSKLKLGYMTNPHKDGYVLINFPGKAKLLDFLKEIRYIEKNVGVCIVDDKIEKLPTDLEYLERVHFVRGNPFHKKTLEQANLKANRIVIIFPTDAANSQSDSATRTLVDLVSRFTDASKTRIIHVLVSEDNKWLFEGSPSTQVFSNLQILSLVQECQDRFSASIIENLLLNTQGANPQTIQISSRLNDWSWSDLVTHGNFVSQIYNLPCNFLGLVKEQGAVQVCPHPNTHIETGNYISIIAEPNFEWETFEKYLLEAKEKEGV